MLIKEKGFSLIEVLASLVIITLLFTLFSSYFISSYQQNKEMDKMFSSVQLCQSLLDVYKGKGFENLAADLGQTKTVNINEELQLEATTNLPYMAEVKIDPHPDFADQVLIINISVFSSNGRSKTGLEGFVRK